MSRTGGRPSSPHPPGGGRYQTPSGGVNIFDPIAVARSDPFFKRNHVGKVACTLCGVYCNDEHAFTKHTSGKTHSLQLENIDRQKRKRLRLEEEERLDAEKAAAAEKERSTRSLISSQAAASPPGKNGAAGGSLIVSGRFGLPVYTFRTEHGESTDDSSNHKGDENDNTDEKEKEKEDGVDGEQPHQAAAAANTVTAASAFSSSSHPPHSPPSPFMTKVWLDFVFSNAEDGTRPLHRWLSAREQHMDLPADDYFVYLLVACQGYTTVAIKFPARLARSQAGDVAAATGSGGDDGRGESVFHCMWDQLRKEYSLFFTLTRKE